MARTRGIDSNQWLIPPERTISAPQTATATTLSEAPPPAESLTDNINIAPHLDTIQVCEEDRQIERKIEKKHREKDGYIDRNNTNP